MYCATAGPNQVAVENHPDSLLCPILGTLMADPVVAADGHSYERAAILEWFKTNATSPMTGLPLSSKSLTPNYALRKTIDEYCSGRPDRLASREYSRKPDFIASLLESRRVVPVDESGAPWEFDKHLLATTAEHAKKPVIICTSRASLNTGEGVILAFEPTDDGNDFRLALSHPLKLEKRFATDASLSCIERLSDSKFVAGMRNGGVSVWQLERHPTTRQLSVKRTWQAEQDLHLAETTCVTGVPEFSLLPEPVNMASAGYTMVASGSMDGTVKLWNRVEGALQWKNSATMEHRGEVRCVAASIQGHILSGGADWSIKVWDPNVPSESVQTLDGHSREVRCITTEPVSRGRFASGSSDENVIIWDPRQKDPLVHKISAGSPVLTICWGDGFVCAGGGTAPDSMSGSSAEYMGGWVRFWDPRTWRMLSDAAIPTSGIKLSSGTKLNPNSEKYLRPRSAHEVATYAVNALTLGGHRAVISGGDDKMLRLWLSPSYAYDPFSPKPQLAYQLGGDAVIPISVDALETFYL